MLYSRLLMHEQEQRKKNEAEELRIKEWEIRFDAERKKKDEEQYQMEEELRLKEEERRKKLEINFKDPNKIN